MTQSRQNIIVYIVNFAFSLLAVLICDRYPAVWIDEVLFADPVISFLQGKGFTSTVWFTQSSTEFWSGYPPLYQYLLIPWLKVFGISITAVRSFGIFCFFWANIVFLRTVDMSGATVRFINKLWLLALLWLGQHMSLIYLEGRSDALTALLAALAAYTFFLKGRFWKLRAFLIGFVCALPGIQLAPYIVIVLAFAWIASQRKREVLHFDLRFCTGVLTGLAALMLFLYTKGVLYVYLTQTFASGAMSTGEIMQAVKYADDASYNRIIKHLLAILSAYKLYVRDVSALILSGYLVLAVVYTRLKKLPITVSRFLVLYLLIPVTMLILGKYPVYYSWMSYMVVAVGVVMAKENLPGRAMGVVATIAFSAACMAGLPLSLYKTGDKLIRQQESVKAAVRQHTTTQDVIYGEHVAYYACKTYAKDFYATSYAGGRTFPKMPEGEKQRITHIIVKTSHLKSTFNKLGNNWTLIDSIENSSLLLYKRAN